MAGEPYGSPFNEAGSGNVVVMFLSGGIGFDSDPPVRSPGTLIEGGLTFAPRTNKEATGILAAVLGLTGQPNRLTRTSRSGAVPFSGSATRMVPRALLGSFPLSGVSLRSTALSPSGGIGPSSGLSRSIRTPKAGSVGSSGIVVQTQMRALEGLIAPAAAVLRGVRRKLTGAMVPTNRMIRDIDSSPLSGGLSFSGSGVGHGRFRQAITSAVSFVGVAGRTTKMHLSGVLSMVAERYKKLVRSGPYGVNTSGAGPSEHSQTEREGY